MTPIEITWVQRYVDQLLAAAKTIGPGSMQDAILTRADNVMDLIQAWKAHLDRDRK